MVAGLRGSPGTKAGHSPKYTHTQQDTAATEQQEVFTDLKHLLLFHSLQFWF